MTTVLPYEDDQYGTQGWLVYDGVTCRLAAGGCRVQRGLTPETLTTLASRMTLKQRVLGANVDGAKCGLDLDPHAPHRDEVLRRFIAFLRDELTARFSMGCDMGTTFAELEAIAVAEGIPSIKYAITSAQDIDDEEFFARIGVLEERVGMLTLGQLRAGHAVAHAALSIARHGGWRGPLTCGVQGFGTLGRGAAHSLLATGVRVVAVADEHGCAYAPGGLDLAAMLAKPKETPVPQLASGAVIAPRERVLDFPADLLILAANEDAVSLEQAQSLPATAVVVGANCGLSVAAEQVLTERGVLVVPDFIGGIGGSASMEALFGPPRRPNPVQVLDAVAVLMRELVGELLERSRWNGGSLSDAARDLAAAAQVSPTLPAYGSCPYLTTGGTAGRGQYLESLTPL
jgi:glutamate dehydrogenase (NAD(P)+)